MTDAMFDEVSRCRQEITRLTRERDALLEALKEAADALEIASNGGGVDFYQYAREVRAAIKAVEGETK